VITAKKGGIIFLLLAVVLSLGCSSSKPEGEPTEITEQKKDGGISLDSPEMVLLQEAQRMYQSGMYSIARENFEALRTGYPVGAYTEYADLKIADCYFQEGEYETAAQGFEDFVKNHPISQAVPYALYVSGRAHQLANTGVGRDPVTLDKAAKAYERLTREYPKSFYTLAAVEYQKEVMEKIAAHEAEIIAFYHRRDKEGAAGAREALYESQLNPKVEGARKLAEEESDKERERLETASAGPEVLPPPVASPSPTPGVIAAGIRIQEVHCENSQDGKPKIFIHLDKPVHPALEKEHAVVQPADGKITFAIPEATGPELIRDCPGTGGLTVKQDGSVELKTDRHGRLMSLEKPDRILILLD